MPLACAQVTVALFGAPLLVLASTLLLRNRSEVRRLAGLTAAACATRGSALGRRALGAAWVDLTSLPGLVLYETGTGLAEAAGAGPRLRAACRRLAHDAAALPEALALATLDAAGALLDAARSGPAALCALAALAVKDAAALPGALAEATGLTPLAELLADTLRGGQPLPVTMLAAPKGGAAALDAIGGGRLLPARSDDFDSRGSSASDG
jgi:hypothetical protein